MVEYYWLEGLVLLALVGEVALGHIGVEKSRVGG
jgi:hypothetical protein